MAFALWGGVLADRIRSRKAIVHAGQLIHALTATIVGVMLVTDILRFEHLLIAAFLQGTVNSVMMPARVADRRNDRARDASAHRTKLGPTRPIAG
jgi:MFS family permease